MRPIDADALIEDFENSGWQNLSWVAKHHWSHAVQLKDLLVKIIGQSPTINPEDLRPKGKWIIGEMGPVGAPIHCSKCGWGTDHADPNTWLKYLGHNFCGACGAKMEEIVCQDG